jgi:hypothetical protein
MSKVKGQPTISRFFAPKKAAASSDAAGASAQAPMLVDEPLAGLATNASTTPASQAPKVVSVAEKFKAKSGGAGSSQDAPHKSPTAAAKAPAKKARRRIASESASSNDDAQAMEGDDAGVSREPRASVVDNAAGIDAGEMEQEDSPPARLPATRRTKRKPTIESDGEGDGGAGDPESSFIVDDDDEDDEEVVAAAPTSAKKKVQ